MHIVLLLLEENDTYHIAHRHKIPLSVSSISHLILFLSMSRFISFKHCKAYILSNFTILTCAAFTFTFDMFQCKIKAIFLETLFMKTFCRLEIQQHEQRTRVYFSVTLSRIPLLLAIP